MYQGGRGIVRAVQLSLGAAPTGSERVLRALGCAWAPEEGRTCLEVKPTTFEFDFWLCGKG